MKIKNLTSRNITVSTPYGANGTTNRINVIAGSTLELTDEEYAPFEVPVKKLVKEGVIKIMVQATSKMTKAEIIAKVLEETEVELKDSMSKPELQDKAEALGVEV